MIPFGIVYLAFLWTVVDAAIRGEGGIIVLAIILRAFLPDEEQVAAWTGFHVDIVLLIGLAVLAVVIYQVTIGRYIHDARARHGTVYGITKKRVIIMPGLKPALATAFQLRRLPDVRMQRHRNGAATISLNPYAPVAPLKGGGNGVFIDPIFDHVPDGEKVFAILRDAVDKARRD